MYFDAPPHVYALYCHFVRVKACSDNKLHERLQGDRGSDPSPLQIHILEILVGTIPEK